MPDRTLQRPEPRGIPILVLPLPDSDPRRVEPIVEELEVVVPILFLLAPAQTSLYLVRQGEGTNSASNTIGNLLAHTLNRPCE